MRAEDLLWDLAVAPGNQVVYRKSGIWEAFLASQKGPVVLVIDEIDKAHDRAEELLLRTLEKFSFRDPFGVPVGAVAGNLVVIATSNRKRELMEPTLRRFPLRIRVDFPDRETQKAIITACLPSGFDCPEGAVDLALRLAEHLRKADVNKAPSYSELGELLWNAHTLLELGVPDSEIKFTFEGGLWKNGDFPGIPFNWVKALRKELGF